MRFLPLAAAFLLTMPLCADWPEPDRVGAQVRASVPSGDLSNATGTPALGVGGSLMAELHFDSQWCGRLYLGYDAWRKPNGSGDREVDAAQLGAEVVYFLQDDGSDLLKGPYLTAGVSGCQWSVGSGVPEANGTTMRIAHPAGSVGIGMRMNNHMDAEVRVMAGQITPDMVGGALEVGLNFWF